MAKNEQTFEEYLNSFPKFKDLPKETQDQLAKNARDSKDRAYNRYLSNQITWEEYASLCEWKTKTWKVETFYFALKMARTMGFMIAKFNQGVVTY